jgi:DNA polymerase I-like protein with 3'-5' exonuclease and polymerase domains/5'-3' exonuclease
MKRLLLDMSAVLWQNLLAGKDEEFGKKLPDPDKPEKMVHINSAEYGFENFVNNFVTTLGRFDAAPREVVMVFDGQGAKQIRQSIYADYKKGRSHHPASYEEFEKLRAKVMDTLLGLGALAVWQDGMEADDVMAYLAKHLKSPSIIVSSDGDMAVLQTEESRQVQFWNAARGELNGNKYGPFPTHFITLYKALVGDSSDNIKGAHKFGPKAFLDMLVKFGDEGLEAMEGLITSRTLERLAEDLADMPSLQRVIDSREMVYTSWALARMYPEKVNTMRKPLQMKAGMVRQWNPELHDSRLKQWYGTKTLVHAGNWGQVRSHMLGRLLESPDVALDIEGSAPPESIEWLEAKKRAEGIEDGADIGVDILGMDLCGLSMTFGRNAQHTIYATHGHVPADGVANVSSDQIRQLVELTPTTKPMVVHNAACELVVLHKEWGVAWEENGWHGFLPNVYDTMVMKSYVDENTARALKFCSSRYLGYEQVTYEQVTQGRRMNQLSAHEAFDYGCDDTICTSALFNFFRFAMELEDSMRIMELVGRKPLYLNALRFLKGTPISLEKMFELERADKAAYDAAWAKVRGFLISKGWEGTVCPRFSKVEDLTAAAIKEAFLICTGVSMDTQVRTPSKLAPLAASHDLPGAALFASCLDDALKGDPANLNDLVKLYFKGEPEFNTDSNLQMRKFLYEVLGLPVRLRQKPTDKMKKAGIREGNPKGDDFALQFAIKYDADRGPEVLEVLKALQTMRVMATRSKLYYVPYRHVRHWKTGLVHSNVRQFSTVTRRDSDSDPNKQQLGKNVKHGHKPLIRGIYGPHRPDAVVVSIDYTGQELVIIAEQSQDPAMVACFVPPPGQQKKNMHAITGAEIWRRKPTAELCRMMGMEPVDKASEIAAAWLGMTYERFMEIYLDPKHPWQKIAEEMRQLGKKVNFTTEYGAQAQKLSETLIITPEEGQQYVDAKEAAFPRAAEWKREVVKATRKLGYATTMLGARRHLAELINSDNAFEASKAERQGVNFKVQGSAAEQTKQAEAGLWDSGIYFKYDAVYIGPVHDELVSSCRADHLIPFLKEKHAIMTRPYAGMKIPPVASISFGRNYQEQIEVGEEIDERRILEALQKLGLLTPSMTTA